MAGPQANPDLADVIRSARLGRANPVTMARIADQRQRGFDSVIEELNGYNYKVSDKLIAHAQNGQPVAYLRVVNKIGKQAYVMVDDSSLLANISLVSLTAYERPGLTIYSMEEKKGQLACAGNSVCGVALIGRSTVSIIHRDQQLEASERTFIYAKTKEEADREPVESLNERCPISFPVIRLREIQASPLAAEAMVTTASALIRKGVSEKLNNQFEQLREVLVKLHDSVLDARMEFNKYEKEIAGALATLEKTNGALESRPPSTAKEIDRHKDIIICLGEYNQVLIEQMQAALGVVRIKPDIVEAFETVRRNRKAMREAYETTQGN